MNSSVVGRSKEAVQSGRSPARINNLAEEAFVSDMMKISERVLAQMPPAERKERLKKLTDYLASLDETVPKRA